MIGFIIGLFVGVFIGITIIALLAINDLNEVPTVKEDKKDAD